MRSLKALDGELAKRRLLFGRASEKESLGRKLGEGGRGVLLSGLGGMGKTTLMVHALSELGGVPSPYPAPSPLSEAGHALYFEDLEAFIRFLKVRSKPVVFQGTTVVIRWDEQGVRKERDVRLGGSTARTAGVLAYGTSTVAQKDRMVVEVHAEMVIERTFDAEVVTKLVESSLTEMSEALVRSISDARGSADEDEDGAGRISRLLADYVDGAIAEQDRMFGLILSVFEGRVVDLVEGINKQVYMSAATYLRGADQRERVTLREFEEGLASFLENANLDRLVPGESTFWNWYISIDHIEHGVPGWTLETKRQAVKVLYDRLAEREGFHLLTAVEGDPLLIFPQVDTGNAVVGFDQQAGIALVPLNMPSRDGFVQDASAFIVQNVEDLGGLEPSTVPDRIGALYDRCRNRIRLYYLVRGLRSLPTMGPETLNALEPDASFLDRQIGDALNRLGVRQEHDMITENMPAVQPLLVLSCIIRPSRTSRRDVSRDMMAWLVEAFESDQSVDAASYTEVMSLFGVLSTRNERIGLYSPYVEHELRVLAERSLPLTPLVRAFQSPPRLARLLTSLSADDLMDMSNYLMAFFRKRARSLQAERGIVEVLLEGMDHEQESVRQKRTLLLSMAVLAGALSPGEKDHVTRLAQLFLGEMYRSSGTRESSLLSGALHQLTLADEPRRCACCGNELGEQCLCSTCHADYRLTCAQCGGRNPALFTYCSGCGSKLT